MAANRFRLILYGCAVALALTGAALMVSSPRRNTTPAAAELSQAPASFVRVPALTVTSQFMRERATTSGIAKPIRSVTLVAEVDGKIVELGSREHEPVSAGQAIVRLDDAIRKAALDRAEAAVLRAQSAHRLAELDLDRQKQLFAKGATSQADLDRAISEERATRGAVQEAEAMRTEAREYLARTLIHAPVDGVLTSFDLEVGDRLQPGSKIGDVIDVSEIEIEIGVTSEQLVALRRGDRVEVDVAVFPDRAFTGSVRQIGSAVDPTTRKFPVEIVIPNPQRLLLPGMVANVTLEIGDEQPAIRIPREATQEEFGLTYVFVLKPRDGHHVAERRRVSVRPIAFRPSLLQVVEGLEENETIAAGQLRNLRDGLLVSVEETS
jgi:RND family efflux transporter MFP subunit